MRSEISARARRRAFAFGSFARNGLIGRAPLTAPLSAGRGGGAGGREGAAGVAFIVGGAGRAGCAIGGACGGAGGAGRGACAIGGAAADAGGALAGGSGGSPPAGNVPEERPPR